MSIRTYEVNPEGWGGKRHNTILKIKPWKHIFVQGYMSYYTFAKDKANIYFGGGAGWVAPFIKVGLNFTHWIQNANYSANLLEAFVN